jgi:hypothetical protein
MLKASVWLVTILTVGVLGVAIERMRELRRRRSRKRKLSILKRRAAKANASEKGVIATKLRKLTPGADVVIARLGLEER